MYDQIFGQVLLLLVMPGVYHQISAIYYTVIYFRKFFNLYVGWGQKYEQFNPSQPPLPEVEYPEEFIETNDPTVELENAVEEARRAAALEFTSEEYTSEEEDNEEQLTDEEED
jgi:hypothetical protein